MSDLPLRRCWNMGMDVQETARYLVFHGIADNRIKAMETTAIRCI